MSGFKPFDPANGLFNPSTDINIERIFESESAAATQNPAGLGVANAAQIEFGPAVNSGTDPVQLLADGTITFNQSGTYRSQVALQYGRSGASGTSELLFRVRVASGPQLGRSIITKIANSNDDKYFENNSWLNVTAPLSITFEVMRDAAGNDSGGLVMYTPTVDGGSEWNSSPTAFIRIERWVS